jgi:hypothetical protein
MKKVILCLLWILFCIHAESIAQAKPIKFEKAKRVLVSLKGENSTAYQTITDASGKNSFIFKTIPDSIVISFLDENYASVKVMLFTPGVDTLYLSVSGKENNTEKLSLSSFSNGKLVLSVLKNQLSSISGRPATKGFVFTESKSGIAFILPDPEKPKPAEKPKDSTCNRKKDPVQRVKDADTELVKTLIQCIYCDNFPDCKEKMLAYTPSGKGKKGKAPCDKEDNKKTAARFICVYEVDGEVSWYKNEVSVANKIDIKKVKPVNRSEITVIIKGKEADEDYIVTADGNSFFMEESGKAADIVSGLGKEKKEDDTRNETPAGGDTAPTDSIQTAEKIKEASINEVKTLESFNRIDFSRLSIRPQMIDMGQVFMLKPNFKKLEGAAINNLITRLNIATDSIYRTKKAEDSIERVNYRAWQEKQKNTPTVNQDILNIMSKSKWKEEFLALDKVLERINARFAGNDFMSSDLAEAIARLQQGIKSCLHFAPSRDPEKLRAALNIVRCSEVDSMYLDDCDLLIESIVAEYKLLLSKTANGRRIFTKVIAVPDEDEFKLEIKAKKTEKSILERTFMVKGGFKIDFSSGIFFTGLASPDFILAKSNFKYYESQDTILVGSNGVPRDSVMYTGKVLDASGNFIRENKTKLNYGAGFFAHGYWRTGAFLNYGGVVGLVLNNSGQLLGMLGGSLMFRAGKNRLSIISGVAIGKKQFISASAEPYMYKEDYRRFENGQTIYQNLRDVPRFYDNGAENKVQTYEKWTASYFFGVSFNFATISPGGK